MKYRRTSILKQGAAGADLILVAGVVILLGIVWALTGGAERAQNGDSFGFQQVGKIGVGTFFAPIGRDTGDGQESESSVFSPAQEELIRTRDFGEISPYWGSVAIAKLSRGPQETQTEEEYVVIDASSRLGSPLSITGWQVQSMISNRTVTIPEATKVSTSGNVNIEQPIVISPRERIFLLSGHSPNGTSFQVNKCSGYFEQFQDFTPKISKQCPYPDEELEFAESDITQFGDACLTFIEKDIPRCEMYLNALPQSFPDACHLFITEKINYNSCVKNHRSDQDFFKPEWRVYLKSDSELWEKRDIIRLLDKEGKTVDVFSYK